MSLDRADIVRRLFDQVDSRTADLKPDMVRTDAAHYTAPERFAREIELQFLRYPMFVGLTGELRCPGSFKTMEIAGIPLLIIRGEDGVVRAFRNACAHRAAQVVTRPHGEGLRRLSCPYHG